MKRIYITILIILSFNVNGIETIFDSITWTKENSIHDIELYYHFTDTNSFFKAQTVLNDIPSAILTDALMNFKEYHIIFPKTAAFTPVETFNSSKYIIYTCLDFFPLKKRDAYIAMDVIVNATNTLLYWMPAPEHNHIIHSGDIVRTDRIYGRWSVHTDESGNVHVSVEYSNDWKVPNVPQQMLNNIQKTTTADALRNLLKYSRKSFEISSLNPQE